MEASAGARAASVQSAAEDALSVDQEAASGPTFDGAPLFCKDAGAGADANGEALSSASEGAGLAPLVTHPSAPPTPKVVQTLSHRRADDGNELVGILDNDSTIC